MARSPAQSRYSRDVLLCSAVYGVSLIAGAWWFRTNPAHGGALAYVVALVPALAILGIFAAVGRYLLREDDEYLRLLMVRQSLVASGFAVSLATLWGFLESFGLAPHLPAFWIAVVWFVGLGLGAAVNVVLERR